MVSAVGQSRTRQDHFKYSNHTISLFILTVPTGISFNMVYFENMCLMDKYTRWDCSKVETIGKVITVNYTVVTFIQRFLNNL